ncbi:hypothetical protein QDW14_03975 [Corynebacterium bovis]|uniref:hypothetical protein n=1 Tax=Corynebacterium bovis TaxID=36808 RepID=UPI00244AFCB7|nr:hypothetical protein [Corynebacterium bovis]MDH2455637.1 hypothetical protein [Corynebacterium bovis]
MLAISVSVPSEGRVIEAAVADDVPVAELLTHLVSVPAGARAVLRAGPRTLPPELTLAEAGVGPGASLTLDRPVDPPRDVPPPPVAAVAHLTGPVRAVPLAWIVAVVAAVTTWRTPPVWDPTRASGDLAVLLAAVGLGGSGGVDGLPGPPAGTAPSVLVWTVAVTALAAVACATASVRDRRYVVVAAVLGGGLGLHVNVLTAAVLAFLLVWRRGPVRTVTVTLVAGAVAAAWPGVGLVLAVTALTFSGQLAMLVARVTVPPVPGVSTLPSAPTPPGPGAEPGGPPPSPDGAPGAAGSAGARPGSPGAAGSAGSAGSRLDAPGAAEAAAALTTHSALVVGLCAVVLGCAVQIVPWGSAPTWGVAALLATAVTGLSARGCRPVHAVAVTVTSIALVAWVAAQVPWGVCALVLLALPLVRHTPPLVSRGVDVLEGAAFAAVVPLGLATTGLFELVRGLA